MAGTIYSGAYTTGINLTNPATQRPATVTGKITSTNSAAIFGSAAFAWTVNNRGTIDNTGTSGNGINLLAGGTVNNLVAASGTTTPGSLIEGYFNGVQIQAATGSVDNLGTIKGTGTASIGVNMAAGGTVFNGNTSDTTASISGVRNAILIYGGPGIVTNFGTLTTTVGSRAVVLRAGGDVTNGSSSSTAALISGPGGGVYISYGSGTVTNFGTISGATTGGNGVALRDGGRVTNGQSGSTAGLIIGVSVPAVIISVASGTVTNFGTIEQTSTSSGAVGLIEGGSVANGAVGAVSALIAGPSYGVYAANLPATVTNFGTIQSTSTASGNGINFEDGGSVTNFGTVENTSTSAAVYLRAGGSVTNSTTGASVGLISGDGNAIAFRGGAGTVVNSGSVESSGSNGIYINLGGSVTNQAGGVIAGHLNGIYNRGVAITVANSGLIETTGTADGIYLRGAGSVTNNAGGTITGSAAGIALGVLGGTVTNHGVINGVIGFYGGYRHSGNNTLINFGTVASTSTAAGAVAVQMGNSIGSKLLVVEPGAVFTGLVEGGGRGEIQFAATGTAAMGANISGFETVTLANGGADNLTLAEANLTGVSSNRITVVGGNDGNTVNASALTTGAVTIDGGAGADVLTGDAEGNTHFVFTATALTATDMITGSNYNNELDVTTPGTVAAGGVTGVEIYRLANGGANSLTLANGNFTGLAGTGGPITIYGGTGGNTIDGSGLTVTTDPVIIYGGAGADVLEGGAGNDIFAFAAANLTITDTISGGGGNNELLLTSPGTVAAGGVTGVETYVLANGAANTLTLTSGNFTGVTGSTITVSDGNGGNTVSAAGVVAPDRIIVYAGAGADVLTGGPGNDIFYAGGDTTMTGGAGANEFVFSAPGTNTITDFTASDEIFFSNTGFNLGVSGTGALPPALFTSNPTGAFTATTQRFAYDTADGELFYSAVGTTATEKQVFTLTGAPALTAAELFHTPTAVTTYSGTITTGIGLGNPATQRAVTVTGTITNTTTNSSGIFGNSDFPWTINNRGAIEAIATTNHFGIQLVAGGTVNNIVAASGTATPGSLIAGYSDGILIEFAPGTVSNLGTIEGTGTNSSGVNIFDTGGRVVNGSPAVTTALISSPSNGIVISGGAGMVSNFGTIDSTGAHTTIRLNAGGNVSNGSSTSTAALIANTGSANGVYVGYGAGTVTNFGAIKGGATGVVFNDGGRVTNGQSGSTAGSIVGTTGNAVSIAGTAGTVANFGTIQAMSTNSVVFLGEGGTFTNGAVGATTALITGTGPGVDIDNNPGTVANFGRITATSTSSGTGINLQDGGSVTNFGTVQNTDTSDAGVYLHGSGSVTNSKTGTSVGLISGAGTGVSFRGGAGTVTNAGSITSSTANGVYLNDGGSVTNQAGGVIAGHTNGVYDRGVAIKVTNAGLIETTGTADGINLRGGGTITNGASGSTAGVISGSAAGIYLRDLGGVVTNYGTAEGVIGFCAVGAGANTLINFGTIASTSTAAGAVAVEMGSNVGRNLLVVEKGAVFTGLIEGGGRGEIEFAATGTAAMGGNISGFDTVALANGGADSLTLANANFSAVTPGRITVIGGNDGNTVSAAAVTAGSVTIDGGTGADVLTGGSGNDIFVFTAAALTATDKIAGGGGSSNELEVTSAGTVAAAGVTAVEIYHLANGGSNSLTLANANFTGVLGGSITVYGGNDGNTIDGSTVTGATDDLDIYGGAGADVLKGGAGNDIFSFTAASLTNTDTISGGGGNNELRMTTPGTVATAGVTGVQTIVLADGGANSLTLASGNFTGIAGSSITVSDGNKGNTVSASGVAAPDRVVVYAGSGADVLTGGPGNDVFYAGGDTTMTGGAGANEFAFSAPGTNTIADFTASATNEMLFTTGAGFSLPGATSTPAPLGSLFVQDSTGTFTATSQRFAYGETNGNLYYSAGGTTASEHLVAHLTGDPTLSASQISQLLFAT